MSTRGKPIPTKLKVLRGNPGKKKLNKREPQPAGKATPPDWLKGEALVEWNRVTPELERLGLLTSFDRAMLSGYCQSWADYVEAMECIGRDGATFVTKQGYIAKNPMVTIKNEAWTRLYKACSEFGFTPSARTRIQAPSAEKPGDDFLRFVEGAK